MSLGTFEPEGFSFTEAGREAILKELEEQIDVFVEEQVGEILEYLFEEDEHNTVKFEEECATFEVLHDGEFYVRKTGIIDMANALVGDADPEQVRKTSQALKKAAAMLDEYLDALEQN